MDDFTNHIEEEEGLVSQRDKVMNERVVRKLDVVLLPFLSLLFLVNSLDRSNVGNAETAGFTKDAGLEPRDLNDAVALFFIVFVALQPVGAALGRRFGIVLFLPPCMLLWGICTSLHVWVHHRWQLLLIRVTIAALEAGFYPVTVLYISLFYTKDEFAKRLGVFYGQYAVAGALGGIISYLVFTLNPAGPVATHGSWQPWQLLFWLEGGLTIMFASLAFLWLPRAAGDAWFLSQEERLFAEERMRRDRFRQGDMQEPDNRLQRQISALSGTSQESASQHEDETLLAESAALLVAESQSLNENRDYSDKLTSDSGLSRRDIITAVTDWKIWYLLVLNILSAIPASAFGIFLPLVVKGLGFSYSMANLFTAPPFLTGAITLWTFIWWSDRRKERIVPILWGLGVVLVGLCGVILAPLNHAAVRYLALCVLLGGSFVASPLTVAWLANNIPEPGKRSIVLGINGLGNLAGLVASILYAPRYGPDYLFPFYITFAMVSISFLGFILFKILITRENARRQWIRKDWSDEDIAAELMHGRGPHTSRGMFQQWLAREKDDNTPPKVSRNGDARITFVYGL